MYLFHFRDITDEGSIVHKVVQLLQLAEILHIILPNDLKDIKVHNKLCAKQTNTVYCTISHIYVES